MFANRWELLSLLGLVSLGLAGLDFYCYKNHSPYLKEDVAKINQVRGFYTMLDDIGRFDLRELGERILWSEIMPYAVAFKLAPKVAIIPCFTTNHLPLLPPLTIALPLPSLLTPPVALVLPGVFLAVLPAVSVALLVVAPSN